MRKNKFFTVFLVLLIITGMSLLLYPTFSDLWNKMHASRAIVSYVGSVENSSADDYDFIKKEAEEFNANIRKRSNIYNPSEYEQLLYPELLNIEKNGVMGYIEIPSIKVSLPIYHGVSEKVLQIGVGHMEWTALPVGGEGTHCVLSGHRGLPSARLFTDLDKVKEGDTFSLHVLDEIYTYEVDQILTVLPEETKELQPVQGKDLCTLVTCTPYGINTHRLLVRGHRIPTPVEREKLQVSAEATITDRTTVAVFIAVPVLLLLFLIALLIRPKKAKAKPQREYREEAIPQYTGTHAAGSYRRPPEEIQIRHKKETQKKRKGGAHVK